MTSPAGRSSSRSTTTTPNIVEFTLTRAGLRLMSGALLHARQYQHRRPRLRRRLDEVVRAGRQLDLLGARHGGVGRAAAGDGAASARNIRSQKLGERIDLGAAACSSATCATGASTRRTERGHFTFRSKTRNWVEFCPTVADLGGGALRLSAISRRCPGSRSRVRRGLAGKGARADFGRSRRPAHQRGAARANGPAVSRMVDMFLPSRQDAAAMFPGQDAARRACKALRELSPETPVIVIKCGADGAIAHRAGAADYFRVPSAAERAVDETGAGDAFCGGAIVGFSRKRDLADALMRAAVSASFAVDAVGTGGARRCSDRNRRAAARLTLRAGSSAPASEARESIDARRTRDRKEAELDEEKKVMLQEIAMQPDFVRDNVDSMLAATRERARRAPAAGASARAS